MAIKRKEIDKQWEEATPEVRKHYGKDYFYRPIAVDLEEHSCPNPDPVLDAIEDALISIDPKTRYLVPGSDRLFDKYAV